MLEAAYRTGGHVFTYRDGAGRRAVRRCGAEQFTKPGYDRYWSYVREFNLEHVYYPRRDRILRWIDGRMYTPEMLADPKVLGEFGLNRREIEYLATHPFPELAGLYYAPYLDASRTSTARSTRGLNDLDGISTHGSVQEGRRVGRGAVAHRRPRLGAAVGVARGHPEAAGRAAVADRRCTGWSAATRR